MKNKEKNLLQNFDYYGDLYQAYSSLLSPKQKRVLSEYFEYNLSLREIAQNYDISSSAVHDALKKGINKLEEYEEKLKLYQKQKEIESSLEKWKNNEISENDFIEKLEEINNGI